MCFVRILPLTVQNIPSVIPLTPCQLDERHPPVEIPRNEIDSWPWMIHISFNGFDQSGVYCKNELWEHLPNMYRLGADHTYIFQDFGEELH